MKRKGKEPKLLPNVMEAIADLKEKQGSSQKQIIEHLTHLLKRGGTKNVGMHVKRALDHGINSGLLKQKGGKFSLGLDKKDYAIFKRFRQITKASDYGIIEAKRRRRKRGKRGRRRRSRRRYGRRRSDRDHDVEYDDDSARSLSEESEPADKSRRRRRRRRRSRRRRGRRRTVKDNINSDSSESVKDESNANVHSEKGKSDQEKNENEGKVNPSPNHTSHSQQRHPPSNEEDDLDCNQDCICDLNQDDSPRCLSTDDFYQGSYIN